MVVFEPPLETLDEKSISCYWNKMFWFHCNGCYCQPQPDRILRFFITNCSHIYCDNCVTACTKEKCKVCHSQCTTLELSGKLQPEVERLFADPGQLLPTAHQQLQHISQILDFQKSHQRRWIRHLRNLSKHQSEHLEQLNKLMLKFQGIEKENTQLRKENQYLKCLLSKTDPHARNSSKNQNPGAAVYSASPHKMLSPYGRYQNMISNHHLTKAGSSNILNYQGRILMRTPPSCGRIAPGNDGLPFTPASGSNSGGEQRGTSYTPLSVPRPICLNKTG